MNIPPPVRKSPPFKSLDIPVAHEHVLIRQLTCMMHTNADMRACPGDSHEQDSEACVLRCDTRLPWLASANFIGDFCRREISLPCRSQSNNTPNSQPQIVNFSMQGLPDNLGSALKCIEITRVERNNLLNERKPTFDPKSPSLPIRMPILAHRSQHVAPYHDMNTVSPSNHPFAVLLGSKRTDRRFWLTLPSLGSEDVRSGDLHAYAVSRLLWATCVCPYGVTCVNRRG